MKGQQAKHLPDATVLYTVASLRHAADATELAFLVGRPERLTLAKLRKLRRRGLVERDAQVHRLWTITPAGMIALDVALLGKAMAS